MGVARIVASGNELFFNNSIIPNIAIPQDPNSVTFSPFGTWQSIFSFNYKKIGVNDVKSALALLNAHAIPYKYFSQYKGKEAIEAFEKLPPKHYQSGWTLQHVGRSHFEMAQYEDAETAFEKIQMNEPYRLEGLEIYSTILWHLKKDKKFN